MLRNWCTGAWLQASTPQAVRCYGYIVGAASGIEFFRPLLCWLACIFLDIGWQLPGGDAAGLRIGGYETNDLAWELIFLDIAQHVFHTAKRGDNINNPQPVPGVPVFGAKLAAIVRGGKQTAGGQRIAGKLVILFFVLTIYLSH